MINQFFTVEPSGCGSPDKEANTTITGNGYNSGSVIKYNCPEGHMLVGSETRTCTPEGFWSDYAPTCKCKNKIFPIVDFFHNFFRKKKINPFFPDVDCGPLQGIEHGSVQLQNGKTTFGAVAIYSCHENYTLIGKEKRICGDGGEWTEQVPQCLRKFFYFSSSNN